MLSEYGKMKLLFSQHVISSGVMTSNPKDNYETLTLWHTHFCSMIPVGSSKAFLTLIVVK